MSLKSILFLSLGLVLAPGFAAAAPNVGLYDQRLNLYQQSKYEEALKVLMKAYQADKKNWQIPKLIGDNYLKLDKPTDAVKYYWLSLALNPKNPTLEYFVSEYSKLMLNPTPSNPVPISPDRFIEFSVAGGPNFPFKTNAITKNWLQGWQADFFLGIKPTENFAVGFQGDLSYLSNYDPILDTSFANWPYTVSNPGGQWIALSGGNMAVVGKYYLLSPLGKVPFYLMGGPGFFFYNHPSASLSVYNIGSGNYSTEITPAFNGSAFSLQWGVGLPIRYTDEVMWLLQYRMVYAFTPDPLLYGTADIGLLFYF